MPAHGLVFSAARRGSRGSLSIDSWNSGFLDAQRVQRREELRKLILLRRGPDEGHGHIVQHRHHCVRSTHVSLRHGEPSGGIPSDCDVSAMAIDVLEALRVLDGAPVERVRIESAEVDRDRAAPLPSPHAHIGVERAGPGSRIPPLVAGGKAQVVAPLRACETPVLRRESSVGDARLVRGLRIGPDARRRRDQEPGRRDHARAEQSLRQS